MKITPSSKYSQSPSQFSEHYDNRSMDTTTSNATSTPNKYSSYMASSPLTTSPKITETSTYAEGNSHTMSPATTLSSGQKPSKKPDTPPPFSSRSSPYVASRGAAAQQSFDSFSDSRIVFTPLSEGSSDDEVIGDYSEVSVDDSSITPDFSFASRKFLADHGLLSPSKAPL
jgi:hypothetical protein